MDSHTMTIHRVEHRFESRPAVVQGREPVDTVLLITAPGMIPFVAQDLDAARDVIRSVLTTGAGG